MDNMLERKEKLDTLLDQLGEIALVKFPVIGSIEPGFDCCSVGEYLIDYTFFPEGDLEPQDEYFVLRIKGDSMCPKLLDGDRVLVRRSSSVDSGKIAIVLYKEDEATAKIINYEKGQDWLELVPINPEYKTKRIEGADVQLCFILGEVVKLQRDL